jgi:hypothetical protein
MTLAEQLQELRTNILRDRSDIIAGDTDSLWSDETLLLYIKDAERRFARRTLLLRDSNTIEATTIKIKTGIATYVTHKSVIAVLSARFGSNTFDLQRSGHALVTPARPAESLDLDTINANPTATGAPVAYYTDETAVFARQSAVTVTLYPVPTAVENNQNLVMRVIRLPMGGYTSSDLTRESEIPEDYQLDVLEWAAYRAQRGYDGDAGAPTQADQHRAAFEAAIATATQEAKRKMFANVGFQYGANGFAWGR